MTIARVGDIDIYYEEHGDRHAEPVLLIMGFITNAAAWGPQIPALTSRFRVVAFDNRGSGRTSQPPGPYSIPQMADDAAGLLDHLQLRSTHVIGASMGGMIAQELTLRHPDRVRSLVLTCTTPGGPRSFGHDKLVEARREAEGTTDLAALWTPQRAQEFALELFTPAFLANPGPGFGQYIAAIMQHPSSLESTLAQGDAVLRHDTFDRLGDIAVPTLVVTGADDALVDARNSPLLAERIPGAELAIVPGSRHAFTAERPDEYNKVVVDFLSRHLEDRAA